MRYLLAILLPPLAVATVAGPIVFILNVILCLLFWLPGIIHALFVVQKYYADQRHKQMLQAIKGR